MTDRLRHGSPFGGPAVGHFRTDPNISTFGRNANPDARDDESPAPPDPLEYAFDYKVIAVF